MSKQQSNVQSVGRQRPQYARVFIKPGSGKFTVNAKPYDVFFGRQVLRIIAARPLVVTESVEKFDVVATVNGGEYCRPGWCGKSCYCEGIAQG